MLLFLISQRMRGRASDVPSFGKFVLRLEVFVLVCIVMGVVYGISEHASWFDSTWLVWQTVTTVGYGDIPPKSIIGRTGVMVCGLISILILSTVVSAGLDYRDDNRNRKRIGMEPNPDKNSYLLICCRDEEELFTFITELRIAEPGASICVVDDILEELPAKVAHIKGVQFVRGPILSPETYERAGIASCCRVIVFPHQPGRAASDATTQTLVTLAERLVPKNVPVMHFLVDPTNEQLFDGLRSQAIYSDFAIYAAIQECKDEGSVDIFTTLMSNSRGANPNTFYPKRTVGWTWLQFVETALKASSQLKTPMNPLALIHAGKSDPCPSLDRVIEKEDALSLIVNQGFDYAAFELEMSKLRP